MTCEHYQTVSTRFDRYVDRFRDTDGALPAMQELKRQHTACVVADANRVMEAEGWNARQTLLGQTAALLHDIGRFSQYAEFRSFQDSVSVNHAERGCEVLLHEGVLEGVSTADARIIRETVRLHNVLALPLDTEPLIVAVANVVRDADKLDIFRVFEEAVKQKQFKDNPEIAWNLQMDGGVSEPILAALEAGGAVDYRKVSTFCDFVMVQVAWLSGQLRFAESRRLARERRVLEYREELVLARDANPRLVAVFAQLKKVL